MSLKANVKLMVKKRTRKTEEQNKSNPELAYAGF